MPGSGNFNVVLVWEKFAAYTFYKELFGEQGIFFCEIFVILSNEAKHKIDPTGFYIFNIVTTAVFY